MKRYDELLIKSFERACEKYPDRTAIIYIGEKFSYRRLKDLIDRFATALHDLGVKKNDRVMLYIPRSADVIKYKGYRISCSEIEAVLQGHTAVVGACVVGVPDPKVGERIKAIVVLKHDARGVGATELLKWRRERLSPYKVPG